MGAKKTFGALSRQLLQRREGRKVGGGIELVRLELERDNERDYYTITANEFTHNFKKNFRHFAAQNKTKRQLPCVLYAFHLYHTQIENVGDHVSIF